MTALELGVSRAAGPPRLRIAGEAGTARMLVAGTPGAGKTSWLGSVVGAAAVRADVQVVGIDAKAVDMVPWASRLSSLAIEVGDMQEIGHDLSALVVRRRGLATSRGWRWWRPSVEEPTVIVVVDELAVALEVDELREGLEVVARLGRAFGVAVVAATQQPSAKVFGSTAVRSMFAVRAALFDPEHESYRMTYAAETIKRHAHVFGYLRADRPGLAVFTDGTDAPRLARAYYWSDADIARVVEATRHLTRPFASLLAEAVPA